MVEIKYKLCKGCKTLFNKFLLSDSILCPVSHCAGRLEDYEDLGDFDDIN